MKSSPAAQLESVDISETPLSLPTRGRERKLLHGLLILIADEIGTLPSRCAGEDLTTYTALMRSYGLGAFLAVLNLLRTSLRSFDAR